MSPPSDPAETYRQEAQELLQDLEAALLDLEAAPGDRDRLDGAFRAMHTIKGSGAMFGFDRVAAFTHHLEHALDQVRKGALPASRELFAVALGALDHIRLLIECPAAASDAQERAILAALHGIVHAAGPSPSPSPAAADNDGPATYRIRIRLPRDALAMGTNPLLLLDELRRLGECTVVALTDSVPPLDEMDPFACYLAWDAVLTTDRPRSAIEDVFIFVLDEMELKIERIAPEPKRLGEILVARGEVDSESVADALERQPRLGDLLVDAGQVSADRVHAALAEQQHVRRDAEGGSARSKEAASIRVQAERLDDLMDQVGELVIAQARLKQLAAASDDLHLKSVAEDIERLAAEMRGTTMGIRLVPIGSLFGRFRRLVRDLSRDLGKEVHLTTAGEDTELDKTVIERLNDPLVHLIRNSIDHGIEDAPARAAAGKPREGEVRLEARHAGAQVLISIRDDGRGLDREGIRAKAQQQGLLAADARIGDAELFQYVFHPGFSTASRVTNVSGRGVGMDVVKRTIESLRGTIDVASTAGGGTEVTLRLPLTLAIIDGLLVRVGGGRYVIPLSAVEECVALTATADARSKGRNFLNIRGELVPFLRLRELFGTASPPDPYQKVVIVSSGELRVGLVVDQVIGDHQTVIKSLSKLHADVQTFSGATILGDGTVALILDVGQLITLGQAQEDRLKAS